MFDFCSLHKMLDFPTVIKCCHKNKLGEDLELDIDCDQPLPSAPRGKCEEEERRILDPVGPFLTFFISCIL